VQFDGPEGVLHGDLQPGNVLVTATGPVLIDFEGVVHGPLLWDLVTMAVSLRYTDADLVDYGRVAEGYGYDVRTHPDWPTLARARYLAATVWLGSIMVTDTQRDEFALRMRYWREGPSAPLWTTI
jgi:thiamine kinase-like enzyme